MASRPVLVRFLFGAIAPLLVSAGAARPAEGRSVPLEPAPCTTSVSPTAFSFGAAGGTGTFAVALPSGCTLSIKTDSAWIHVMPPTVGGTTATSAMAFLVDENTTSSPRSGTLAVNEVQVTVKQEGAAPCAPLAAPLLASPADGAADLPPSVSLSWAAVPGATIYDVYLGNSTNPPLAAKGLAGTTWPASNLPAGKTWYWRVVARRSNGCADTPGASSALRTFTTASDCQGPSDFQLLTPPDGAAAVPSSVDLAWQASAGAATYDVYLASSAPPQKIASGVATTRFHVDGLSPGAKYVWTVVARSVCNPSRTRDATPFAFAVAGACQPPGPTVLLSPAAGATLDPGNASLTWARTPGAASYDLYLGPEGSLVLYAAGIDGTSFPVPNLAPGTWAWRVVSRSGCSGQSSRSEDRRFTVAARCTPPPAPAFLSIPSGPVASGQSYVLTWSEVTGLGSDGTYVVERSSDPSFAKLLDRQVTAETSASFLPRGAGNFYHRVRAFSGCVSASEGTASASAAVTVVPGAPNAIITVPPAPVVVGLGESLSGKRTRFVVENIGSTAATVLMGQGRSTATPFFDIVDPAGGDARVVTLEPRSPKAFDVVFGDVATDRPETYQGVVFCTAATSNLAVTPFAFVTLRVAADGALATASPEILVGGAPTERIDFPLFSGDDDARAPVTVTVRNPGTAPMELVEEIGPEAWLAAEPGWNATPLPAGASRDVHLSTQREKAPAGSGFPRYTYFGVRARGGGFARVLVVDNDLVAVARGRGTLPARSVRSRIVPAVVNGPSLLGNLFVSRLDLTNAGTEPVAAELVFTPAGADGFDADAVLRAVVEVRPNDVLRLEDPLGGLFGLAPPVSGTLEVRTAPERAGFLTVASSVETPARGGGALGFALPILTRGEGARLGAPHSLAGLAGSASKRTNVLLVETTGVETTRVRVTLRGPSGAPLGSTLVDVPRYGLRQLNSAVELLGGSGDGAGLDVEVVDGGGAVAAVATVVDRANDDASAIASRPSGTSAAAAAGAPSRLAASSLLGLTVRSVVPSLVGGFPTFPGTGRTETFATRLGFTSLSSAPATFVLSYRDLEGGGTVDRTVEVPGRSTVEFQDAVVELFGLAPGTRSQGPLFVDSTPNGILFCQVYSVTPDGLLGDALPVVDVPGTALTGRDSVTPLFADGLEQSTSPGTGTRSNLILNEVNGREARVTVRLYEASNRTQAIAEKEIVLPPLAKLQLSTVFRELGLDSEERRKDRTNVLVSVTAAPGTEGLVSAVVTRIDNRTGDTRNLLLTPSGGVAGAGGVTIGF
ncbi:MAG: BACON domain-containing protein [Thermoanaerobaculia bacterium]